VTLPLKSSQQVVSYKIEFITTRLFPVHK